MNIPAGETQRPACGVEGADRDSAAAIGAGAGRPGRIRVLVSADSERYQDKKIPADHSYIKQVHNPEEFSDSQRGEQHNPPAKL